MFQYLVRLLVLVLLGAASSSVANAADWSQFRGPLAEGENLSGVLPAEDYGLTPSWSIDLGSGYSNISSAGGKAITVFTSDDVDVVAAFDTATGEELWRYELGDKYAGHDGSTDGPLSTPAIAGGSVYVLGPNGQLAALDFESGAEKWRRDLDEETSTPPFYGYTSSPVVADGRVMVATGGEERAVTAFDAATGETLWSAGSGKVTYQTPILVELEAGERLLTVTDKKLLAIDPTSGAVDWEIVHTEGNETQESSHVVPVDSRRFLVGYNRGSKLYEVGADGPEVLWESNAFGNTFAIPVLVGDHFYGFTGRFLTSAAVDSGEIAWRSRPPQGLGLSVIDDVLAVLAPGGELVLIDPSPEGYRELTRVAALDAGDYAVPTYADGRFLVRNLGSMAAVAIDAAAAPQAAAMDPADRLRGAFGEWIASVEALPEAKRQAAVDARFAEVESTPIVEDGGWAHFVWRGEAGDVGVMGDFWGQGQQEGLYPLSGTNLFFRSVELDPEAQYQYLLAIDFAQPQADPGNPLTIDNGFGLASDLRMPGWPESPHLDEPAEDAPRGDLDTFPFRSEILDNTRQVQVWRPPSYGAEPETRYPVLVVNHGDNLVRGSLMRNTLDNLVGEAVAPVIAVFVPRLAGPEYGGEQVDDYVRFLTEELLPHLDHHYRTDPARRAIMGPGSAGVTAVYAALKHPEVFGRAAVQSYYPIEPAHERIAGMAVAEGAKPDHVYVVWSRHDYDFDPERMPEKASPVLVEQLESGGIEVTRQIVAYSPGWGGWRGQHDEILAALFPLIDGEGE